MDTGWYYEPMDGKWYYLRLTDGYFVDTNGAWIK